MASLAGASVAVALAYGSASKSFTGTRTGFVEYTFIGGTGIAAAELQNMSNPKISVSFNSLLAGNWTVSKSNNCVTATLNAGQGQGGASVTAYKADGAPGQIIRTGGKTMGAGDFLEACAF